MLNMTEVVVDETVMCGDQYFYVTATTEIYTARHTLSLHDALPILLASALFSFLNRRKHSEREVGEHILVIDEGTTSTRAMLFDLAGNCLATSQRELTQYYPEPGHVEHDAGEIWDKTLACAQALVERAGGADRIAALGIRSEEHTSELQVTNAHLVCRL